VQELAFLATTRTLSKHFSSCTSAWI